MEEFYARNTRCILGKTPMCKIGDSNGESNRSRDMRLHHIVTNDDDASQDAYQLVGQQNAAPLKFDPKPSEAAVLAVFRTSINADRK